MKTNILITSISAKVPLIKTVIEAKNKFDSKISIYGADCDEKCIGRYFVDCFWQMPKLTELDINNFIAYCHKNNIKYIIPTRDSDVIYFASFKDLLLDSNIHLFSADEDIVNICFDKLKFFNHAKNKFVIPTYTSLEKVTETNLVVKERFGSGSTHIAINVNKPKALKFAKSLKEAIFQPFIKGEEFSIDSYVAKDGRCIACIIRSRDLVKNGESQITTYVEDPVLSSIITKFVEDLHLLGHSVTQVIKNNNSYNIIECNTRFGGASTLSYKMGLESFYWFLCEVNNKKITFKQNDKKLKQVRVAEDKYFEC